MNLTTAIPSWVEHAACEPHQAALFDETPCRTRRTDPKFRAAVLARVGQAATICGRCPVRHQCLQFAITEKLSGIYGGAHLHNGEIDDLRGAA